MQIINNNGSPAIDLDIQRVTFIFDSPTDKVAFINALTAGGTDEKEFSYGKQSTGQTLKDVSDVKAPLSPEPEKTEV